MSWIKFIKAEKRVNLITEGDLIIMAEKRLFELLAVEAQMKNQAASARNDLKNTFEKKRHLFGESRVTFQPLGEGQIPKVEEQSDIQSTIPKELLWIAELWSPAIDNSFQVAEGNTRARADVILDDGSTLLRDVPATALLELEKRANELHDMILAIPTLDPAKGFKPDADRGKFIYQAREINKTRTKKVEDHIVVVPPTVEHPAQVVKVTKDEPTGTIIAQEWSGLITPAKKSELLNRAEILVRAIKKALHRANAVKLDENMPTCAKALFDYVYGDIVR